MNSASWNPFPLSWKQRLAVAAWMLYLLSLTFKVWDGHDGFTLLLAFFGPPGFHQFSLFLGLLLSLAVFIPSMAVYASAYRSMRSARIAETDSEVLLHVSMVLSAIPLVLLIFFYPDYQFGFFVWWASILLAACSLGMKNPPGSRRPFQFRLGTLVMLNILVPLCVYANLSFLSLGSSHSALAVRVAASVLALILAFDLWKFCGSLIGQKSSADAKA